MGSFVVHLGKKLIYTINYNAETRQKQEILGMRVSERSPGPYHDVLSLFLRARNLISRLPKTVTDLVRPYTLLLEWILLLQ